MTKDLITEEALPRTPSLRSLALKGTLWTVVGHGSGAVIRLGGNLVLTHLLDPKLFGIMALVRVFMNGLHMFSDVGVVRSVVRHAQGDQPRFLHTAWTVQVLRGAILCAVACALAWPVALFFDEPDLSWCIPLAGLTALIASFNSINLLSAQRNMALGRLQMLGLIAQVTGVLAMILCAWLTGSILALILGGAVGATVILILSHASMPGVPCRFGWEAVARRELFGFGKWIFASSTITFIAMQLDKLVLGRIASKEELGFYWIAAMLSGLVKLLVELIWDRVLYPSIAKKRLAGELDAQWVFKLRHSVLWISAIPVGVVYALAEPMVSIAYDSRYQAIGPLVAMFLIGDWLSGIVTSYNSLLLAAGQPKYKTGGTALKAILVAILIWPTYQYFGTWGVALMSSLTQLGVLGFCMVGAHRMAMASPLDDLMASLGAFATGAALLVVYQIVHRASHSVVLSMAVVSLLGAGACGLLAKRMLAFRAEQPT